LGRFWRRSREWPVLGHLAFALLVIFVAAAISSAVSDALHGPDTSQRGTAGVVARPRSTTSNSTRSSTTTRSRPAPSGLIALTIAPQSHESGYNRDADFGGWIDQNGCQDTRAVLLIRASLAPVTFTSSSHCTVNTGRWTDPWSGVVATVAHAFQIDHTVPLNNAWVSGAWSWSHAQRVAYANDLADTDHLVAINASENESKGADGPDQWRPPSRDSWCRYALVWDRIKAKWHLSVTRTEWAALVEMAATC
jgi:hypothetical protein